MVWLRENYLGKIILSFANQRDMCCSLSYVVMFAAPALFFLFAFWGEDCFFIL